MISKLEDLREPRTLQKLKWAMSDPESCGRKDRQDLTEDAAGRVRGSRVKSAGSGEHDPGEMAHFINRLVFCMFAEEWIVLPSKMFVRMFGGGETKARREFQKLASSLFQSDERRWLNRL